MPPLSIREADARNPHERTAQRAGLETPSQERREGVDHRVGSVGQPRGESAARSFPARCRGNAQPASCGCAVPASRSLAKLDFQAWVGFDFFHDLVVARHHIPNGHTPPFGCELAQFVEVQGCEPFNLENVGAVAQARIFGQTFGDRQTSGCRDDDWPTAVVDVFAAAANDGFARCRGDVDSHIPNEKTQ